MEQIIANALKEQLRVMSIFLDEYKNELDGKILYRDDYQSLKEKTNYVKEFIINKYHI